MCCRPEACLNEACVGQVWKRIGVRHQLHKLPPLQGCSSRSPIHAKRCTMPIRSIRQIVLNSVDPHTGDDGSFRPRMTT